mmetsp:Transcript_36644/g.36251  ORF Transcript_36644/g.36251 Transcript_36644/m.36251 type:complete len:178 (+) Transcript_36644:1746-2279(+)
MEESFDHSKSEPERKQGGKRGRQPSSDNLSLFFRNCKPNEFINLNGISNKLSLEYNMQAFNQDLNKQGIYEALDLYGYNEREKAYFQDVYNKFYKNDDFLNRIGQGHLSTKRKVLPGDLVCEEAEDPLDNGLIEPDINKVKHYIDYEKHIKSSNPNPNREQGVRNPQSYGTRLSIDQ